MPTNKVDELLSKEDAQKWSMKPNAYDMDGSQTAFSHSRKEAAPMSARFVFLVTLLSIFSVIGGVGGILFTGSTTTSQTPGDWLVSAALGAGAGCFAVLLIWAVAEKIVAPRK